MNYLLDTHTFIWFGEKDPRLHTEVSARIKDSANDIFVSIASLWEIAIKVSLNKLDLHRSLDDIVRDVDESRTIWLPIIPKYIRQVGQLPFHHRDPFDRLIIAQGLVEGMIIITKDPYFEKYGVLTQWS